MRYFKEISNGYIASISTGFGEIEITDIEYNTIMQKIRTKPTDPEGYIYKIRADNLEWELTECPAVEPTEEEADIEDYENALSEMGVDFND